MVTDNSETSGINLDKETINALMKIEAEQMSLLRLSKYINTEWYKFFFKDRVSHNLARVFFGEHAKNEDVMLNDILDDMPVVNGKRLVGVDSIKKRLQEGIDQKIIKRQSCSTDKRTKCYTFYSEQIRGEVALHCSQQNELRLNMMLNALDLAPDSLLEHYTQLVSKRLEGSTHHLRAFHFLTALRK